MHDCNCDWVGMKAAQMGFTETALNRVLYGIDVGRTSTLYILPNTSPDASDFSSARFDPALQLSPHLRNLFSDVKNVGHKRAGTTNLYIRGSRSKSGLKSVPVGRIVFDELDEMDQKRIPLADERMSGHEEKQKIMISTPTVDNFGIHAQFKLSTQEHYQFKCPHCSKWTELVFPDCIVVTGDSLLDPKLADSHLICKECKHKLDHAGKKEYLQTGRWVAINPDAYMRGFYVNQLYSITVPPFLIAQMIMRAKDDVAYAQELNNSKMGLPYTADGAKITDEMLSSAMRDYSRRDKPPVGIITMGVDVGTWLHYEIDQWFVPENGWTHDLNMLAHCKMLTSDKVASFDELDSLMQQYQVNFCVIDANPERRKAYEFASRFLGHVRMCFYGKNRGKEIVAPEESLSTSVERTTWMDLALGRFKSGKIIVPRDLGAEPKEHIKAPVRIYEKDADGNPVGRYVETGPDHAAHARLYSELALPFAASQVSNQDVRSLT